MYHDEEFGPKATQSEAHAEWHRNAGVPMGQAPCPWDACDPLPDFAPTFCIEFKDEYGPRELWVYGDRASAAATARSIAAEYATTARLVVAL
jgi:hypothetical protein